jgi:predicted GNAT family N-acyltransferase
MICSIASKEDIDSLVDIWGECFDYNDRDSLRSIFYNLYPITRTYIYKEKKRIISSISVFDISYKSDKGVYFYGLCTLPLYRGNGLSIRLLNDAIEILKQDDNKFFLLRPASESLFDFYHKIGFSVPIKRQFVSIPFHELYTNTNFPHKKLTSKSLYMLRNKNIGENLYKWNCEELDFIINFYNDESGIACEIENGNYFVGCIDPKNHYIFNILEGGCKNTESDIRSLIKKSSSIIKKNFPYIEELTITLPSTYSVPKGLQFKEDTYILGREGDNYTIDPSTFFSFVME